MSGITRWATPTWIFFHTFAAKINTTFFEQNRAQCLQIIKMICECLPCPDCTIHATRFMKRVNTNNVKTKNDLIDMLFAFHNEVNIRTYKTPATRDILKTYESYRIDVAYINFMHGYPAKYGSIMSGRISTLGKRKGIARSVQKWMQQHWRFFQ